MPVITEQSPLGAGLEAAGGVLLGKRQNDIDERNYLLQKSQADSEAAYRNAEAQTEQGNLALNRRVNGLDQNGNPIQISTPDVGPGASLDDQYKNAILKANAYAKQGAMNLAGPLYQQADKLQLAIHQAKQDALAYMREADNRLRILAQAQHWSAQEKEQARHNAATEAESIRKGNLTYDAAMARVGATLQNGQLAHQDREQAHYDRIRGQNLAHGDRQAAIKARLTGKPGNGQLPRMDQKTFMAGISHLPGAAQKVLIQQYKSGVNAEGIINTIQGATQLTPEQKAAAVKALTPPAQPGPINLNPGRSSSIINLPAGQDDFDQDDEDGDNQ